MNRVPASIIVVFLMVVTFSITVNRGLGNGRLDDWSSFRNSKKCIILLNWIKSRAEFELGTRKKAIPLSINTPQFFGKNGIFITLVKNGRVRGCFGAFHHSSNRIERVLIDYLQGALALDPRHKPLDRSELDDIEIVITVTDQPASVESINDADLSSEGICIVSMSGQKIVFVPEEIKTISYLLKQIPFKEFYCESFQAVTLKKGVKHDS